MKHYNFKRIRDGAFQVGVLLVVGGLLGGLFDGWERGPVLAVGSGILLIIFSAWNDK